MEDPHTTGQDDAGSKSITISGLIDDQEQEKREDRKLAGELTSFFNAVDRVVTMMRVYPFGHPLLDELIRQLHSRVDAALEREGSIFFNIDSDHLATLENTPVFSADLSEKDRFIWYTPYSDGLLQVEFTGELSEEELASFLRVVDRAAAGLIHSDDDTVTLLWEQQLQTIKYFAVEGFVDSGTLEDFGERTEKEAIEMIVDAAIDPGGDEAGELGHLFDNLNLAHLDLFTRMQIAANAKIIVPELRDDDLAYAFAVDPSLVDKLCDEWMAGADLEYRLIEALLSIIRVAPSSAGATRASEMIISVTQQLLDGEMFAQAVRILELLHNRRELFLESKIDPLGDLIDQLSDPMQIEALVNIFQRQVKQRDSMMRLFLLLGKSVVLKQILGLIADEKRKVVALSQLVDIVFELMDEETEAMVTHPDYMAKSIYLRRMMSELPDRDFIAWRPTSRFIRKAIDDPDPEVRELGMTLKHPCWDDPNLAENYLVPMADDPDEGIRKVALELLGEKHPQMFQDAIRDTILARKMGGRTHAELRFLMRIFLDSTPEAAGYLRSLLDTKGWFGTDSVEFAKMAAAVLIEAGDGEAIAKIEEQQNKFFTSPTLKRAYGDILRRFGGSHVSTVSEVSEATTRAQPAKQQDAASGFDRPATSPGAKRPKREAIEVPEDLGDPTDHIPTMRHGHEVDE